MSAPRISALVRGLDGAYGGPAWHGPHLRGALDPLGEAEAAWRPAPGRPNAWELAVHAAYWKYRVLRHVAAAPPAAFDEPGSNFFARPAAGRTLAADLARLDVWHERLRDAAAGLDPERLDEIAYDAYTFEALLRGAAAHDAYHAGQVRLLVRLRESLGPQRA